MPTALDKTRMKKTPRSSGAAALKTGDLLVEMKY
jgi:hypothetical protein